MNGINGDNGDVISSLDPIVETERFEKIYSKFHQEQRKILEILKESDKEVRELSHEIEQERASLLDLENEIKTRKEEKPAEKLASERCSLSKKISQIETDIQEIIAERNRLLAEVQKPDSDQDDFQPDISLSKLALYRYLGLSGLKDESGSFSILEIAPPGSQKIHSLSVDELRASASQKDTTKTNKFWDLLP